MELAIHRTLPRPAAARPAGDVSAFAVSAVLHVSALLALAALVLPRPLSPAPGVALTVIAAPPAPAPAMAIAQLAPASLAVASAAMHPGPLPVPAALVVHPAMPHRVDSPHRLPPPVPAQVPTAAPLVPETSAAPAPPPPVGDQTSIAGLTARIRQAVQDAAIYPPTARLLHRQGRAQVQFDYADGSVAALALAVSSQSPLLDQAALAAVRRAAMPRPPAAIASRKLTLLVWVDFGLTAAD